MRTMRLLLALAIVMPAAGFACTPSVPEAYTAADGIKGGLYYDKWWETAAANVDNPNDTITDAKFNTFRCKECHGWDYKGSDGVYGNTGNSHYTGIRGHDANRSRDPQVLFDAIKNGGQTYTDSLIKNKTYEMPAFGNFMTDADIWNITKFIREEIFDMEPYVDFVTKSIKDASTSAGQTLFDTTIGCAGCHGTDGATINFGQPCPDAVFIGDLADDNPWETLHKTLFGQPDAAAMNSALQGKLTTDQAADIVAYMQTLPKAGEICVP